LHCNNDNHANHLTLLNINHRRLPELLPSKPSLLPSIIHPSHHHHNLPNPHPPYLNLHNNCHQHLLPRLRRRQELPHQPRHNVSRNPTRPHRAHRTAHNQRRKRRGSLHALLQSRFSPWKGRVLATRTDGLLLSSVAGR
jgi:hypothetical protein